MLFCTFVLPLLLSIPLNTHVLVNSLFCFALFIICHSSVKSPTFFTSVLCFDLLFQIQTPGKGLALPTIEIGREFPLGKKGLFRRKNKIQPQRQKITVVWGDTSEKWDPFGCVRTWTVPSGRPPSPAACPRYLRSLCTAAIAISWVQSSSRAAPLLPALPACCHFPAPGSPPAGTKHSQPQRSGSPHTGRAQGWLWAHHATPAGAVCFCKRAPAARTAFLESVWFFR